MSETQDNVNNTTTQPPEPTITPQFDRMSNGEIIQWHATEIINHNTIKTMEDNTEMYLYNKDTGAYTKDAENRIMKYCSAHTNSNTMSMYKNIVMNIKGRTMVKRSDFSEQEGCLNLLNGVLCLQDMTIHHHDPKYNFKGVMNVNYDPKAECKHWKEFLEYALQLKDIRELQKWFGYHFTSGQLYQMLLILFGVEKSGKTLILNALAKLLGDENISPHSLQDMSDPNSHATDNMYGKIANIDADMKSEKIHDVSTIKKITGGDMIPANPKHKSPFQYRSSAKQSFACNNLPQLSMTVDEDPAFWRRIKLIEFKKQVQNRDIHYLEKVIVPELPGILNWAIEGYRMLEDKGFVEQDSYTVWHEALIESNPLLGFYQCFTPDPNSYVTKEVVRQLLDAWCTGQKIPKPTDTKFGIHWKRLGVGEGRRKGLGYTWEGIKLTLETYPKLNLPSTV
jgi:putative DNA primase/helicase